jgi:DNA-binding response OmpR family regulator
MDDKIKILVVDDDVFIREILEEILSDGYRIIGAGSGMAALSLAQDEQPALILLDVGMHGMNGYETCRQLKQSEHTAAIPVIFVSVYERIEDRINGYDAGGNDYLVKPFDPQELKARIAHLLELGAERARLKEMMGCASNTAMTAMTSMGEMGALLESLKQFNASVDEKSLAESVLAGLSCYGLNGVVQVHTPQTSLALSGQGEASPLEISVIDHMNGMDRIVHFKSRMSIHYPHVAMLVNNMPAEDTDRCGRLRDHLAMLLEGAEARVAGIMAENESRRRGLAIEHMIGRVNMTLNEIDATQRRNRMEMRMAFAALTDKLCGALLQVSLTLGQEDFLFGIVSNGIEEIINVQSAETDLQNKLTALIGEMNEILR